MHDQLFDDLARSRRTVLGGAIAGLSAFLAAIAGGDVKKKKRKKKRKPRKVTVQGVGQAVTRDFRLVTGNYIATANVTATSSTGGLFFANLHGPKQFNDYTFIENPEGPDNHRYESLVQVPKDGDYFFEISEAEDFWRIVMKPK